MRAGIFGVAEEIEPGGAGPHIENAEDFAKWLEEARPSPDVCVALAARAALRALPIIARIEILNSIAKMHIIPSVASSILRMTAITLLLAKYPRLNYSHIIYNKNLFKLDIAIYSAIKLAKKAENLPLKALSSTINTAKSASILNSTLENIDSIDRSITPYKGRLSGAETKDSEIYNFTNQAVGDAVMEFSSDSQIFEFWFELEKDMRILSLGGSVKKITDRPLWDILPPNFISNYWTTLADALPDTDNWQVWKNWYEDILKGKTHSEAHDMIYATVPIEEWDKGPAAANAWIAARLAELEDKNSATDINLDDFPKPLDDVPSLFTFGLNTEGKIDIVAGPQNTPVIAFAGDEATHRQWLDTARELARRLAADLREGIFGNVRSDYSRSLERYADDLPTQVGKGNFLLADHEIIAIYEIFGAEAGIIPEPLAAQLNTVMKAHYSLLAFYPETKRYHEAAQTGRLAPPAPEEAFAGFVNVVREFTPEKFAPSVLQELEAVHHEAPIIRIDEEDKKIQPAIEPAPYPFDFDILRENRLKKFGVVAALCNLIIYLLQNPDKMESWMNLWKAIRPFAEPILRSMLP